MSTTELTQANVSKLPRPVGNQVVYWDTVVKNFGLVVTKNDHRSYCIQYRVQGRSKRMHLTGCETLADARQQARALLGAVSRGKALGQLCDPLQDRRSRERRLSAKFADVAKEWMEKKKTEMIAADEWERVLKNNILPTIGNMLINSVKRSIIIALLEKLAADKGKSAADKAYKIIKSIMDWYAKRQDDFVSPIVKGLWTIESNNRKRALNDAELKDLWTACDDDKVGIIIGSYAKMLILTLCRRDELRLMRRSEIATNGIWIIPAERMKGMKGKKVPHLIPLPQLALDILTKIPRVGDSDLVFTNDGKRAIAPKYAKDKIDRVCKIEPWTFHDTRRTSRGLMVRAKVNDDIIERCLAHKITGIKGVYNVYEYNDEKKQAFANLADMLEEVVTGKKKFKHLYPYPEEYGISYMSE